MRWFEHGFASCKLLPLQEKQYGAALALAAEIIEHGVREHPELGIGSTAKGQANVRRIPNSPVLQVSAKGMLSCNASERWAIKACPPQLLRLLKLAGTLPVIHCTATSRATAMQNGRCSYAGDACLFI